jgi:hypothetical protein
VVDVATIATFRKSSRRERWSERLTAAEGSEDGAYDAANALPPLRTSAGGSSRDPA